MKLKYFIGGADVKLHPQLQRFFVEAVIDEIYQPIFPTKLVQFRVLFGFEDIEKTTKMEARINSPSDKLMQRMNFELKPVLDKKIINYILVLDGMPLEERGDYTIDLLVENENGDYKFFTTCSLLHANYPIRRIFREGEIDYIIESKENLIKSVKVDYEIPEKGIKRKFELSLDPDKAIEEGYEKFPDNDTVVHEGKEYDLTGIRRQVEWAFGRKIEEPKEDEKAKENDKKNNNKKK